MSTCKQIVKSKYFIHINSAALPPRFSLCQGLKGARLCTTNFFRITHVQLRSLSPHKTHPLIIQKKKQTSIFTSSSVIFYLVGKWHHTMKRRLLCSQHKTVQYNRLCVSFHQHRLKVRNHGDAMWTNQKLQNKFNMEQTTNVVVDTRLCVLKDESY